jgi:D-serine deaminase-like pyridoxal phosphate-dependent protein
VESALEIAAAVDASPFLRLVGVEAYEGTVKHESMSENLAAVSAFLEEMRTVVTTLAGAKAFAQTDPVIVSAGGSAYFDLVVDSFSQPWDMEATVEVVLRSGCYVTHDSGMYDRLSPFGARSSGTSRFRPALELWGTVISCPDPDLTIVNFGKRDAPYDAGLPVPQLRYRNGNMSSIDATVVKMNDQHAYLRSSEGDLEVGDHLGCGISHPCTAFDKWPLLPVVDDGYDVVDAVRTLF